MRFSWDDVPFGEKPDIELARELGVSEVAVGKQRRKRGIPIYGAKRMGCRAPGQHAGINWDEQPLGIIPDKTLARRLGVDPSSVRNARKVRERIREHGHKCPVCFEVTMCVEDCAVDEDFFTRDGVVLGRYITCRKCIEAAEKSDRGNPVFLTGPPSFKVGL